MIWSAFPLLLIPVIAFNLIILFTGPDVQGILDIELVAITVASADVWRLTTKDVLLASALGFLFFELLRAADIDRNTLPNYALSTVVLIVAIVEFVAVPGFANGVILPTAADRLDRCGWRVFDFD